MMSQRQQRLSGKQAANDPRIDSDSVALLAALDACILSNHLNLALYSWLQRGSTRMRRINVTNLMLKSQEL